MCQKQWRLNNGYWMFLKRINSLWGLLDKDRYSRWVYVNDFLHWNIFSAALLKTHRLWFLMKSPVFLNFSLWGFHCHVVQTSTHAYKLWHLVCTSNTPMQAHNTSCLFWLRMKLDIRAGSVVVCVAAGSLNLNLNQIWSETKAYFGSGFLDGQIQCLLLFLEPVK